MIRRFACWLRTRHSKNVVAIHMDGRVLVADACACGKDVQFKQFTGQYPRLR